MSPDETEKIMVDQNWLFDTFDNSAIPQHWRCPSCLMGSLTVEHIKRNETRQSRKSTKVFDAAGPPFSEYVFAAILKCIACGDVVSVGGYACDDVASYTDEEGNSDSEPYTYQIPNYFYPPLHLFEFPKALPKQIKNEVIAAFGLYWNDLSSCANKIRVAVEEMMTDKGIKKTVINKKRKRVLMPLHDRIKIFESRNPKLKKACTKLLAIKWIGNEGSHFGQQLTRLDLFTAFELSDSAITDIYSDHDSRLDRVAKEVVKKRGITPKRKSR